MSVVVDVQYALEEASEEDARPPSRGQFEQWVGAVLAGRLTDAELSVRVVGEQESAALNLAYRRKPGSTNVLSFPAAIPIPLDLPPLGDIVICAPVVGREALEQGKAPEAHWAHMTVHGVLHLLGFDHQTVAGAREMEGLEQEILAGLAYPDPYRAPAARNESQEAI
ncbi:MAG TPA: rRNA maturation RNase YbeY [Gammaproteobacteria bacterium]|nr:rRNA maturation RNase YbeY [Gammaproteobacteria bacterium]